MWGLPTFSKIFQRKRGSQTHSLPVCVSGKGPSDPTFNPWKAWPHESQSWNLAPNPQEWWNVLRGRRRAPRGGLSIPGDHPSPWKHPWGPSRLLEPWQAPALLPHPLPQGDIQAFFKKFLFKIKRCFLQFLKVTLYLRGFPAGASGKESTCQCRRLRKCRSHSWAR